MSPRWEGFTPKVSLHSNCTEVITKAGDRNEKQTETDENQSLITNSLFGNKVYICSYHPDRFKSVKIENCKKECFLTISKQYSLD